MLSNAHRVDATGSHFHDNSCRHDNSHHVTFFANTVIHVTDTLNGRPPIIAPGPESANIGDAGNVHLPSPLSGPSLAAAEGDGLALGVATHPQRPSGSRTAVVTCPVVQQALANGRQVCVVRAQDGSIVAATLDALMDHLVDPSYVHKAPEYIDTFFTAYSAFTTDDHVFQDLVRRFNDAELGHPGADQNQQKQTHLRINVIQIMNRWVANYLACDSGVLVKMQQFATSIHSSRRMEELARELHLTATNRLRLPPKVPLLVCPEKPDNVTPKDLAFALAIMEGDNFRHILPSDYVSHLRRQEPNNVRSACKTNDQIRIWVIYSILRYDRLEERTDVLKFFVETANECRKLRNFASMSAIVDALRSHEITRLPLTFDYLPEKSKQKRQRIIDLLDPRNNYNAYKTDLKSSKSLPCIPWLAVHLPEMTSLSTEEDMVDIGDVSMINFVKWTRFRSCVKDVIRHKTPDTQCSHKNTGVLARFFDYVKVLVRHRTPVLTEYRHEKLGVLAYLKQELDYTSTISIPFLTRLSGGREGQEAAIRDLGGAYAAGLDIAVGY